MYCFVAFVISLMKVYKKSINHYFLNGIIKLDIIVSIGTINAYFIIL